ncbi:phosphoribosylamine--glycine ligase, partial [candidate division WOR-3 bacterium]|nr:phosphoribosylamine--glycine ligase [candidate division WOR-3 bacterium]
HAGTKNENNKLVSNGGRILSITSRDNTLEQAVNRVYTNIKQVNIENAFYRNDIAKKGIK